MSDGAGTSAAASQRRDRRSLADNQSHPDAVVLLAASLADDRRAEDLQSVYLTVATLGAVGAAAVSARLDDLPGILAGSPGVVVAILVAVVLARHRHWLAAGEALRERFERRVFDLPAWTTSRGAVESVTMDVDRAAARYLGGSGRRDALANWFTVDPTEPFDLQVLRAQHESVRTGSLARLLWSAFLAVVVVGGVVVVTVAGGAAWPPTLSDVAAWVTSVLPLGALTVTAVRSWRFGHERGLLAEDVRRLRADSEADPRILALLVEERLVAMRRGRVLVPEWFYRGVQPAIRKGAGLPPHQYPGLLR